MTTFIFANNVNTTLAGAVSTSATTITLASTANLPASIPAGSVFVVTLNDAATRNNYEVVYATAITGATLTVLRAQEGTSALAWLVGDYAYDGPTAGQQGSFGQTGGNNTWTGNNTFNDPVAVANATASGHAINLGQAEADFAALNGSSSQTFNVAQATTSTQAMPLGQLPSQFPSSLGANGYKKYPDSGSPTGYFIEQWGTAGVPGNTTGTQGTAVTMPIAFPNSFTWCIANYSGGNPPELGNVGSSSFSLSQILITMSIQASNSTFAVTWYAKGY